MKKIIIISVLVGAFFISGICAMAPEMISLEAKVQKSDAAAKKFEVAKDHALLSITINDLYELGDQKRGLQEAIPFGNVTQGEIEDLLNGKNYDYILSVHRAYNQGADANPIVIRSLSDKERKRRAEIQARALDPVLYRSNAENSTDELKKEWEFFKAAQDLNIPELIEKYARIIAIMVCSDASMKLLQANDQEHIKMIHEINYNRTFADLVRNYISEIWALERTLARHSAAVYSASFSPDGSKIVTASADGTAKIWNVQTGIEERRLTGNAVFWSASFSPDGSKIITASNDKTTKIWNAQTGALEHTLAEHTGAVKSASYCPDGSKIVTASLDNTAKIWNARTRTVEHTLTGHGNWINSASFSPDGSKIVTASFDKTAKIWNAQTGIDEHTFAGHRGAVYSASFSPDGRKIVTASLDKTAKIWNVQKGIEERTLTGHTGAVYSASFSPDGSMIVTASADRTVRIWNALTGAVEHTLAGHTNWVNSASYCPDGSKIVTASMDTTAKIWALPPAHTMEQGLFLHYLQLVKNQGGNPGWVRGWGHTVMESYDRGEKALIEKMFPQTVMQTIRSYFTVGSSSSSSNN